MRYTDLFEAKASDDEIKEAAWWLTRWISGSMDDPEWNDTWAHFGIDRAFEILHGVVGNARSIAKPVLWRFLHLPPRIAQTVIKSKVLPVYSGSHFQSFTGSRDIAVQDGPDLVPWVPKGSVQCVIGAKPDAHDVMFGMADLLKSPNSAIQTSLDQIADWHYQDEVIVRVTAPLVLTSTEII